MSLRSSLANLSLRTYRKILRRLSCSSYGSHLYGLSVHCWNLQCSVVDTNSVYRMSLCAIPVLASRWQSMFLLVSRNGAGLCPPRRASAGTFTELYSLASSLRPGGKLWPLSSCLLSTFLLHLFSYLCKLGRHRCLYGKYLQNRC